MGGQPYCASAEQRRLPMGWGNRLLLLYCASFDGKTLPAGPDRPAMIIARMSSPEAATCLPLLPAVEQQADFGNPEESSHAKK